MKVEKFGFPLTSIVFLVVLIKVYPFKAVFRLKGEILKREMKLHKVLLSLHKIEHQLGYNDYIKSVFGFIYTEKMAVT